MENNELIDRLGGMSVFEMKEELNQLAEELFSNVGKRVTPAELGFDERTARCFWRGPEWLALHQSQLAVAQYYGGLEYVHYEHVLHFGDYVFFSTDDSRIANHWDRFDEGDGDEGDGDEGDGD